MQTHTVSPELQAIADRAYLYAYCIDEAYKHRVLPASLRGVGRLTC